MTTTKPLAIDLFCGAGGASKGLAQAGYRVVGVDLRPQPNYPYEFVQADALTYDLTLTGAAFVWASPPCRAYTILNNIKQIAKIERQDLVAATRQKLQTWGGPYIIENVVGAPLRTNVMLCGVMFGLKVIRHRLFESNMMLWQPEHPNECKRAATIKSGGDYVTMAGTGAGKYGKRGQWVAASGIDWMTKREMAQSIPPAYSEYLAKQVIGASK